MDTELLIKLMELVYDRLPDEYDGMFGDMGKEDIPDIIDGYLNMEIDKFIQRESA